MATALLPLISVALKGFAAFWALVTFAVAAALQSKLRDYARTDSPLQAANAIIAAGVLGFLYFTAALVLIFVRPHHILISVMVDTIVIGFLFVLSLGGTAAESEYAGAFSDCSLEACSLGSATIGLGWVFTFLLLGILLFEVIYTIVHYGKSLETWKTPFNELAHSGGGSRSAAGVTGGGGGNVPRPVPMSTIGGSGTAAAPAAQSA